MLLHLHCHSVAASGRGAGRGPDQKLRILIELLKTYRTSMHYMGRSQILKAREASPTTVVPN